MSAAECRIPQKSVPCGGGASGCGCRDEGGKVKGMRTRAFADTKEFCSGRRRHLDGIVQDEGTPASCEGVQFLEKSSMPKHGRTTHALEQDRRTDEEKPSSRRVFGKIVEQPVLLRYEVDVWTSGAFTAASDQPGGRPQQHRLPRWNSGLAEARRYGGRTDTRYPGHHRPAAG